MYNSNKKTIIVFIFLILAIVTILFFNMFSHRKLNVNRKIDYIFGKFTYNIAFKEGNDLFFQTIELLNAENTLEYEKNFDGKDKFYSINNYNNYRKIINFMIVTNTLKISEVTKFMELKKIIKHENNYYIENYKEEFNKNYIGSILEIEDYDSNYIYFKSLNYYCKDEKYIGKLNNTPECNYTRTETKITLTLENNNLRVNNLEEIKNVIK